MPLGPVGSGTDTLDAAVEGVKIQVLDPADADVLFFLTITLQAAGQIEPGQALKPGQIYDANRFSLTAAVRDAGGEITWTGLAPDDRDRLETLLRERMETDDIILTSGGVSMGELDLI